MIEPPEMIDAIVGDGEVVDPFNEAYNKGFDDGVTWAKDNYETILWVFKQQLAREDAYGTERLKKERDELDEEIRRREGKKKPPLPPVNGSKT